MKLYVNNLSDMSCDDELNQTERHYIEDQIGKMLQCIRQIRKIKRKYRKLNHVKRKQPTEDLNEIN